MQVRIAGPACVGWPYVAKQLAARNFVTDSDVSAPKVQIAKDYSPAPCDINVQARSLAMLLAREAAIDDAADQSSARANYGCACRGKDIDSAVRST